MRRTVLLYGLLGGILVAVLELVQYRYLAFEHARAIYGGLVAAIFAALGIWLGRGLVRVRQVQVEIVREVVVEREVERVVERPATPAAPGDSAPADPQPFAPDRARIDALGITPREYEILTLIAAGLSTREIAARLGVSENTVKTHSSRLFMKLDARRRTQAVQRAKAAGLIA